MDEARRTAALLPGCGSGCGYGRHCIRTCRAFRSKPAEFNTSERIAPHEHDRMTLNLLMDGNPSDNGINNVEGKFVWCQVPCAVDSGACAHVSPPDVFGRTPASAVLQKAKYYAADGSPIDELGKPSVNAVLDEGTDMKTCFDIVKVSRPLLSVSQIVENGHQVIFGKHESFLQLSGSRRRIKLRPEGKRYMLDKWVKLPLEVAQTSPFVRQVSQA